jgi:hypothetical protein
MFPIFSKSDFLNAQISCSCFKKCKQIKKTTEKLKYENQIVQITTNLK